MRYFSQVNIGESFTYNGNLWLKRSSRTAEISRPCVSAGTWFYFSGSDVVDRVKPESLFIL